MGISTGVGGNIGGPIQPRPEEITASAWTLVNKAALGIVLDTIEIPLSQISPGWKYRSSESDKPFLYPPLDIPLAVLGQQVPNTALQEILEALVLSLPSNVSQALTLNQNYPFSGQLPSLVSLADVLTFAALSLAWLETQATVNLDPAVVEAESLIMTRAAINAALPAIALEGMALLSQTVNSGVADALALMGPNDPQFDSLLNFSQQLAAVSTVLGAWAASPSSFSADNQQQIAGIISTLSQQYQAANLEGSLTILGPTLNAMSIVASALALDSASPSLFLSLAIATVGFSTADSALGVVGPAFDLFGQSLISGLASSIGIDNSSNQELFQQLATVTFTAILGIGMLLASEGTGVLPSTNDPIDDQQNVTFSVGVALTLATASGALSTLFGSLAAATGASPRGQALAGAVMESAIVTTIAYMAAQNNAEIFAQTIEDAKTTLIKDVGIINDYLANSIKEQGIQNDQLAALAVNLEQAAIALGNQDYSIVLETVTEIFDLLGIDPKALQTDLTALGSAIAEITSPGGSNPSIDAGIAQAA